MSVLFLFFVFDELLRFRVFRTSVQVVEQINKKVGDTRLRKLPTVRLGLFSLKAPTKNTQKRNLNRLDDLNTLLDLKT